MWVISCFYGYLYFYFYIDDKFILVKILIMWVLCVYSFILMLILFLLKFDYFGFMCLFFYDRKHGCGY